MKTTPRFTKLCFVIALLCISTFSKADNDMVFALICPDDQNVTCEDEIWDLSIYGTAYVSTYNGVQPAGDPVELWNLNACDIGTIYRTWTVEDYSWNTHTCTQVIHVSGTGSFNQTNITWPQNTSLEGCDPLTDPEDLPQGNKYPTSWAPACANVGVTYTDQIFHISNTCKKLRRTWTVIDLCQYKVNGSSAGVFNYFQDIKLTQDEEPVYTCVDTIYGKTNNCEEAEVFYAPLEVEANSCGTEYTITHNSPYANNQGADLSGIYPLGNTVVQYTIHYGCNKKKFCYVNVYVEDISAPTPYCIGKIHTALMPIDNDGDGIIDNGMVEIWAKDFDIGSSSPCGFEITPSFSPDEVVMSQAFTCADVGENPLNVYYLSDNGNYSYCTVVLDVQNNSDIPNCEPVPVIDDLETARIAGFVKSGFEANIEETLIECIAIDVDTTYIHEIDTVTTNVLVDSFVNQSGVMIYAYDQIIEINEIFDTIYTETLDKHYIMTEADGSFAFDSVDLQRNYQISASCDHVKMSYIDKCDLEVLIDHVMGEKIIEDPSLLFAADLDENGVVDFDDVKALMFYLGGIYDELPYDQGIYVFPATAEEFNYNTETSIHYSNLDGDKPNTNFTFIMKGNLCDYENNSQQFPTDMNILTAFSEKLPGRFRNEIEAEIRRVSKPAEFTLYPNPFHQSFVVNVNNPKAQIIEIEVFNSNGQRVYRRSAFIDQGIQSLANDLESEASGIYFYRIKAGETEFHGKVIKK